MYSSFTKFTLNSLEDKKRKFRNHLQSHSRFIRLDLFLEFIAYLSDGEKIGIQCSFSNTFLYTPIF